MQENLKQEHNIGVFFCKKEIDIYVAESFSGSLHTIQTAEPIRSKVIRMEILHIKGGNMHVYEQHQTEDFA